MNVIGLRPQGGGLFHSWAGGQCLGERPAAAADLIKGGLPDHTAFAVDLYVKINFLLILENIWTLSM